jgi:hypothetical protein
MASGGVFRVAGTVRDQTKIVPWTLVLKIIGTPTTGGSILAGYFSDDPGDVPSGLNYWKREVLAYQTGLLDDLPECLVAPRCFGIVEHPGSGTWLWLEDVLEDPDSRWSPTDYRLAAQHLGCFNGAYLAGRPLTNEPWMSIGALPAWVDQAAPAMSRLMHSLDHPLVRRLYPAKVAEALTGLWEERQPLMDALARLPQTLCHQDAFRRNLFARKTPEGRNQTVAIDWASVGIGPVGQDLVLFVATALDFFDVDLSQARELDELAFAGYIDGLRHAGWRGDVTRVRFGYTAALGLRWGLGNLPLNLGVALNADDHAFFEQAFGAPIDALMGRWGAIQEFFLPHMAEARRLLRNLG